MNSTVSETQHQKTRVGWKSSRFLSACILLLCTFPFAPLTANGAVPYPVSKGQLVYIPAYSHIYTGDRKKPFYLTTTLSIRNPDPATSITLVSVRYYDSTGRLLRSYLERPETIGPLAAKTIVVDESDKSGGSGAGFLVLWKSSRLVSPPLVEAIMIGTGSQQGISFTSRGVVVREE